MKILYLITFFAFTYLGSVQELNEENIIQMNKWGDFYESREIEGTFLLKKIDSDSIFIYNKRRAQKPYLPASTYKILNSLISLEVGVISDENEIIKWDGKKRFYDKWNKDQNLGSAFKYSCVWFYQELARRIGRKRMEDYLRSSRYGNQKTGDKIDDFWLQGDLRITPYEQVIFLEKLLKRELPFSDRNYDIVEKIMLVDSRSSYKLYAKTGMTARAEEQVGWYVGFVKKKEAIWIFTNNIAINKDSVAEYRKIISYEILKKEGIVE